MIRTRAALHRSGFFIFLNLLIYAILSKFEILDRLTFTDDVLVSRKNIRNNDGSIAATVSTRASFKARRIDIVPMTQSKVRSGLQQPKEAFVTFSNNAPTYLALLKVLLDFVHAFSTRPIIAYGIDVDLNIDVEQYPRVIKRRVKQRD